MSLLTRALAWLMPSRPAPALAVAKAPPDALDVFDPFPGLPVTPRVSSVNGFFGGADSVRGDSIANATSKLGTSLDKVTDGRPDLVRRMLSTSEIDALCRANGYARRIVGGVPSLATRKGWRVSVAGETEDPLDSEWRRLKAWSQIAEVWRWARQHGGAVLLPILDEDIPTEFRGERASRWLAEPLDLSRVKRVLALQVYTRDELSVAEWDSDPRSSRYRGALRWSITPTSPGATARDLSSVHASRLIYWDGAPVPPAVRAGSNAGFGDSILEACFDQIRNKTAAEQGMAHLMQQARINVLKIAGLKGKQASDAVSTFETRMRSIARSMSITGVVLISEDDEFQTQSQIVSGLGEVDERAGAALAAVAGYPQTVLFGDSPGGLNADGESARQNLAQMVSAAQEEEARERVEWLCRMLFAQREGPTKGQIPDDWELIFAPLDEPTRTERAAIEKTHAETDAIRIASGVVSPEHVARSRFGPGGYSDELSPLEDEDLTSPTFTEQAGTDAALKADAAEGDGYPVPKAVRENARRVLRWREEHGEDVRGMTEVGWRRARQLAESPTIGLGTIRKMASFARHAKNAAIAEEYTGTPWRDAGYVAWLGWGGDEGIAWAKRVSEQAREDRTDAAPDALVVWFTVEPIEPARLEAARSAVADLPGMTPSDGPLHATLWYRGPTSLADAAVVVEEVQAAVAGLGADWTPPMLEGAALAAFAPDAHGRVPVTVETPSPWIYRIRDSIETALRQRGSWPDGGWWFRPHVTLGYAQGPTVEGGVGSEVHERLEHDPAGRVPFRVTALEVRRGEAVLWSRGW